MPKKGRGAGRGRGQPAIEDKKDGGEEPPDDGTPKGGKRISDNSEDIVNMLAHLNYHSVKKKTKDEYSTLAAEALCTYKNLDKSQKSGFINAWKANKGKLGWTKKFKITEKAIASTKDTVVENFYTMHQILSFNGFDPYRMTAKAAEDLLEALLQENQKSLTTSGRSR